MLNRSATRQKYSFERDLIADQTYPGLQEKFNTTALAFNVTEGLGAADNNTTAVLVSAGGFPDQRITADLKWVAPTASPNEDIGVLARCLTLDTGATYYYARVDGGLAKISKVVTSTFTTLTQSAFAVPVDTIVRIEFTVVGSQLTAVFTCGAVAGSPLTLTTTDTDIPSGGLMGFRSLTSSIWCSYVRAEEL